jgi:tRNA (cmo5U34)-methyltransferase
MMSQTSDPNSEQLRAGHHWKEGDRVADYVTQNDRDAQQMAEVFGILTTILPYERDQALRLLDIGSGHGVAAAAVLDAFPNSTAIGLDISEAMMEIGRERMARFGDRFRYQVGDFADGTLPSDLSGPFDIVVSSRAIHHITPDAKRRLFADIFEHMATGGCFMDVDNMRQRDDFLKARYAQADPPRPGYGNRDQQAPRTGGSREHPDPVAEQLESLRAAGFAHVDCYWKRLGRALIGGFKEG